MPGNGKYSAFVLGIWLCSTVGTAGAAVLADSVNDWNTAYLNDGILSQGELGWEYGYISNFTGTGGIFFGWHQNFFYWDQAGGVDIYWPAGTVPPEVVWGEGGDSTGCRPPMNWVDGFYPWAGDLTNRWAATRRWTSNYTGAVDITGRVGRYFDPAQLLSWDILFVAAVNAQTLDAPAVYSRYLAWNDGGQYNFLIPAVPIKQGDTVNFMCIPVYANANNAYIRLQATIRQSTELRTCDLNGDGSVDMADFLFFASYWQNNDCGTQDWCGQTDFNYDWKTDLADLSMLASDWLLQTFPKGDFDKNYRVDLADFYLFAKQWDAADCDQMAWCQECDLNKDRTVDLLDLSELVNNWLTF